MLLTLHDMTDCNIILVSHNMDDVAEYVDRIVVMNHGRKVFDDVPKTVFSHVEELEAMGLAAPQVSYLMHTLQKEGFDVRTDATTIAEATEEILRVFGRSGHTSTEGGPVR